jgi:hypothetical protein
MIRVFALICSWVLPVANSQLRGLKADCRLARVCFAKNAQAPIPKTASRRKNRSIGCGRDFACGLTPTKRLNLTKRFAIFLHKMGVFLR